MKDAKHIYIAVALIILALAGACAYVSSKVASARADQVKQDMAPVHQQAQETRAETSKAEDGNQKALMATLAAIAAQKQQPIATPVDYDRIAQMIEARMGAKAVVKADPEHPDAPSATLPAKNLNAYMLACDEKTALLESCQQTAEHTQTLLTTEIGDHQATKRELAAERKKGGTFFQRFKSNSKWFVIGAGAGIVGGMIAARR